MVTQRFPAQFTGMTVQEAGEKHVIETITRCACSSRNGDDAAVLEQPEPNSRTVVATDMLVSGRHFRLEWSTPAEVGAKAVVKNFADVSAMGARPVAAVLALGAPAHTPLSIIEGIARGMADELSLHNAELVGGDVVCSPVLTLSVTALGRLGGNLPPTTLAAARPGHTVVATGTMGYAAAGLHLLMHHGIRDEVPERFIPLVRAHCRPTLEPHRGVVARAAGATAMTDNSDGLYPDCFAIARASHVSINLYEDAVDPDNLLREAGDYLGVDPREWVYSGGDDYTLIATTASDAPSGFRVIGEVTRGKPPAVTVDRHPIPYTSGWTSFA